MTHDKKVLIGIDGNEANLENRVGVNTYAFELLKNIAILEDEWKDRAQIIVYLKNTPLPHMPAATPHFSYRVLHGGGQWILKVLTPHLYKTAQRPDVFWTPSHYIPPIAPMPRVCSIMDLGYLEFSEQFRKYDFWQLKLWSAWSIKISRKIFAISEATKKDIVKHYPSAREKIVVTPLGYDNSTYPSAVSEKRRKEVLQRYSIGQEYLLFMSTLKPSKNIEGLLRAWQHVEKDFPHIQLVIAGKKGWLFESIFSLTKELQLQDRVNFTDFVKEEDKPVLIQCAKAFVLPSFWEGFGLDVVSSMASGVPVIVSDRGSLPEVVGNAGIIVNPEKTSEVAHAIKKVLAATGGDYQKLHNEGVTQAKNFSWQNTTRQTILNILSAASQQ